MQNVQLLFVTHHTRNAHNESVRLTDIGGFNTKTNIEFHSSNNFYHYYDFSFPPEDESNSMKPYVPDASHLELLSRINQHDRLAGSLGIAKSSDTTTSCHKFQQRK